jgi:hypothetical protein
MIVKSTLFEEVHAGRARNLLSRKTLHITLGAILFSGAALAQTPPASQMELDGTAGPVYTVAPPTVNPDATCTYAVGSGTSSSQPCDYWNSINGTGLTGILPFTGTRTYNHYTVNGFASGGAGTANFSGGGSKDPSDVTQWKWVTGQTPDKDTITNGYAAGYTSPTDSHTILEFGADRFSTSGDANFGAWFFQQNVAPVPGGGFSGKHVNGDVFLISAFTNGGGTSTITVYTWDSTCSASNYATPTALPGCAATNLKEVYSSSTVCSGNPTCATTNSANTTVTWNYIAKASGSTANVVPTGALFTGGIDLTYIFGLLGQNVPCLSAFLMDTRSSQSPSAVLKDFVGGNFQLCAISASAACAIQPSYTVSPASIHYSVNGNVANAASGTLFGLQVAIGSVPAGATNVVLTQPVTPSNGLSGGQSLPFSISFDYPNEGAISVAGSVCAAAFSGGPCTVVNKPDGTAATWSASEGTGTCSITTTTSLSLTKSCVVNLVPGINGVVLQLADTITVCNTDTKDPVQNITIGNNVSNVNPASSTVVSGLTLNAGKCATYTPVYTPTGCVNGVDPAGGGRCMFQDTASISSVPTDEFGKAVPSINIPGPQTATCHSCTGSQCTTTP